MPNEEQSNCKAYVHRPHSWRDSQCMRKATRDGYCAQHHPEAVAQRRAASARRRSQQESPLLRITRERNEAQAELADYRASLARVMYERCGDEAHCTCVPLLRVEVERLTRERGTAISRAEKAAATAQRMAGMWEDAKHERDKAQHTQLDALDRLATYRELLDRVLATVEVETAAPGLVADIERALAWKEAPDAE